MGSSVLIIQRRMTEYRVPMFEELRRRLEENGVRLQVVYGTPTAAEATRKDGGTLPWGSAVPCHYLIIGTLQLVWQHIPRDLITRQDLVIIPHENMFLLNYLLLFKHRWHAKTGLAYWGHGANFQGLVHNGIRERIKEWTARQVDWWFAYTLMSVEKVVASGFPVQRTTCLNNAIDLKPLRAWQAEVSDGERQALLKSLGLQGDRLAVFLGSLSAEKRLDFLFSTADELRRRLPNFELLIIGEGPQRDLVCEYAMSRPWCCWVGARHGREKALYASLGHVMLNPGLVGLNILDSFTFGIPLLTTDCGIHSPEIAYLESGRNGLMVANDLLEYTGAVEQMLSDPELREELAGNCLKDADRYSLENMVENFCAGIQQALAPRPLPATPHVVVIWQRFLPYHTARLRHLNDRLAQLGYRFTAIEVASQDAAYGFMDRAGTGGFEHISCFRGSSYHTHTAREIHRKVRAVLTSLKPDVVFAPATAFPEGMAADAYSMKSGCKRVMMDDAWERTDRRGRLTSVLKRLIHRNMVGVFIPAPSHQPYYVGLGFPPERVISGVDVVDNEYFSHAADTARLDATTIRSDKGLPENYFLFVGRFLARKGLETLLTSYGSYRDQAGHEPWDLVLVGGGPHLEAIRTMAEGLPGVHFAGAVNGDELCDYYGLAQTLIVPSVIDQWALVVNEGLASRLPVLVSRGCGSARTLVKEGENGWTFEPEDSDALALLMVWMGELPKDALQRMGERSQEIIADWSLDRFADGVVQALALPRREPGGMLANLATRLWKGRVSVN